MQFGQQSHFRRCATLVYDDRLRLIATSTSQLNVHACTAKATAAAGPNQTRARRRVLLLAAQRTAMATDDVPDGEDFPPQSLTNFSTGHARRAVAKSHPIRDLYLSLLQLTAVIVLLIICPAWLFCKHIYPRVWAAATIYYVFFGFGGVRRTLKYGKLSSRKQDAQVHTRQGTWAIATFIVLVVAGEADMQSCLLAAHPA